MTRKKGAGSSEIVVLSSEGNPLEDNSGNFKESSKISLKILKKKILYFYEQKVHVHVKLKKGGQWFNGEIVNIETGLFVIEDYKRGGQIVSFEELDHVEKFRMKGEVEEKEGEE